MQVAVLFMATIRLPAVRKGKKVLRSMRRVNEKNHSTATGISVQPANLVSYSHPAMEMEDRHAVVSGGPTETRSASIAVTLLMRT